ncbi:MAG: hypothetical protein NC928_03725 [Candidatus Omnitrophica bacterium]|nr:hypothetical protein [Candidatus Omnitrophota bacterium]
MSTKICWKKNTETKSSLERLKGKFPDIDEGMLNLPPIRLETILDIRTKYVFVEERLNGKLYINYNGFSLKYKLIDIKPAKPKEPYRPRTKYIPPKDHPWRKFKVSRFFRL